MSTAEDARRFVTEHDLDDRVAHLADAAPPLPAAAVDLLDHLEVPR